MKIEYDNIADALHIRFKRGRVGKTVKLRDLLIADLDVRGNLLGLEILEASLQMPKHKLHSIELMMPKVATA